MQSIERYGVVALLFLVVTVIAVLVWEGEPSALAASGEVQAKESAPAEVTPPKSNRIRMTSRPIRRPLKRDAEPVVNDALLERSNASELSPPTRSEPARPTGGIVPSRGEAKESVRPTDTGVFLAQRHEREAASRPEPTRPATKSNAPTGTRAYTVASGDTLSEIAEKQLGTLKRWKEIVALNPKVDPAKLFVGQKLVLPAGDATSVAQAPRETAPALPAVTVAANTGSGETYVVRSGDNMWRIAARTLGDGERWKEIAKLNPKVDADRLFVGQELVVPRGSNVSVSSPSVATATRTSTPTRARRVH